MRSHDEYSPKGLSVLNLSIFVVQPPCINFDEYMVMKNLTEFVGIKLDS